MNTVVLRVDYVHSHMNHKGKVKDMKGTAYVVMSQEEAAGIESEAGHKWLAELLSKKDMFSPCITQVSVMDAKDMNMKVLKEI